MPAARSQGNGSRFVLEHPSGEVGSAPRARTSNESNYATGSARVGKYPRKGPRHAVVGNEMMSNAVAVGIAYLSDVVDRCTMGGCDCFTCEATGEECLADAFAGENVTRHHGITCEENSACAGDR